MRQTSQRPFEPRRLSLRLPLGIAAVLLLSMAVVVSLGSRSDVLVAERLAAQQAQEAAEAAATELEQELQRIGSQINTGLQRPGSAIKLVGFRSEGPEETRWWPEMSADNAPDPLEMPGWFALGQEPPDPIVSRQDTCYAGVRAIIDADPGDERQAARQQLLTGCPEPMIIDEHLVQPEELVAYLEHGGVPGEWWIELWKGLMATSGVSSPQGAHLTARLDTLSGQGGATGATARDALETLASARPFDELQLRQLIQGHLDREAGDFLELHPEPEALFLSGEAEDHQRWVAALDPEGIADAVEGRLGVSATLHLVRAGEGRYPSQATAPLPGQQHLVVVAILPGAVAQRLIWRYRLIVGGLVLGALALIAVLLVAERRRLGELIRIDRLRTEFVGRISHQFRSPLTTIQLYAETLQEKRLPEIKQDEYLATIAEEARTLGRLTGRLLNHSRIQQGQYVFHFEPFDLGELLHEQVHSIERQSRHRVAEVRAAIPGDLPALRGDRESLGEAFVNLLENAVKYTEENGVVSISVAEGEDDVVVTVDDDGPGIPPAQRVRVFQAYYRIDDSLTQRVAGTGLGLTLVQKIIGAHGGRVEIESSPGGGARFVVSLPRKEG